jgi:hypothetical protein
LTRNKRENDKHIKKDRQLELIVKRVADLLSLFRPVALAERNVADLYLAAADGGCARPAHPDIQYGGHRHEDEDRQ